VVWEDIEAHVRISTQVCVWTARPLLLMRTTHLEVISPILVLMRCVRKTVRWVSIVMDVSDLPLDRVRAVRTNRTRRTTSRVVISAMHVHTPHVFEIVVSDNIVRVVTVLRRVRAQHVPDFKSTSTSQILVDSRIRVQNKIVTRQDVLTVSISRVVRARTRERALLVLDLQPITTGPRTEVSQILVRALLVRQTAVREDIDATVVTQTRESVRNVPENPTTHITSLTVDSPTVVNTLHVPRTRVMLVTIVICAVLIRTRLILVRVRNVRKTVARDRIVRSVALCMRDIARIVRTTVFLVSTEQTVRVSRKDRACPVRTNRTTRTTSQREISRILVSTNPAMRTVLLVSIVRTVTA